MHATNVTRRLNRGFVWGSRKKHTGRKSDVFSNCDKTFKKSCDFKKHDWTHTGERYFLCCKSDKKTNQSFILDRHERTHSEEKPFACTKWKNTSKTQETPWLKSHLHVANLTWHVSTAEVWRRTQPGDSPFACNYFDKKFKQSGVWNKLEHTHTVKKQFSCFKHWHFCNDQMWQSIQAELCLKHDIQP